MKKIVTTLLLATALVTPEIAFAKNVTITTQVASYGGPYAYVAIYLTGPDGRYESTIWVAGQRAQYQRHLRGWVRSAGADAGRVDGITGASVGSGQTLKLNVNIADALIDAGYQIHVDSAVENYGEYPDNIVAPLSAAKSGVAVSGNGFVKSLTVNM